MNKKEVINRINDNEDRLNRILSVIKDLEESLNNFDNIYEDINKLNKYYGSNNWFNDKDMVEKKKIENIKCGVLSEDTVWNMNEDINDLLLKMKDVLSKIN